AERVQHAVDGPADQTPRAEITEHRQDQVAAGGQPPDAERFVEGLRTGRPVQVVAGDVEQAEQAGRRVDEETPRVDPGATELRLREAVHDVARSVEVSHERDDAALAPLRDDDVVAARGRLEGVREEPAIEAQVDPVEALRLRRGRCREGEVEDPRDEVSTRTPHRASCSISRSARAPIAAPRPALSPTPPNRAGSAPRTPTQAA